MQRYMYKHDSYFVKKWEKTSTVKQQGLVRKFWYSYPICYSHLIEYYATYAK